MATFLIGIAILIVGGAVYGRFTEKIFRPDDRSTPALTMADGVDYVAMPKWKNGLINLLNIAGTGPILGPIQGILFGPIAFITIPIGCVIGGAMHDYFLGMISMREGGIQMPEMVKRNTNRGVFGFYIILICLSLFLIGVVFVYTPGDIIATQFVHSQATAGEPSTWIIYIAIFAYYLAATVFPVDKIIGKIYPIFGAILLVSAVGVFIMLFVKAYPLVNVWEEWSLNGFDFGAYFRSEKFIPTFFITVTCGILSGFHSTQITIISRTTRSEREGRGTFYNMMIAEGFIAMVWAAGTMAMIGIGASQGGITMQMTEKGWAYFHEINGVLTQISPTSVVGVVCQHMLGNVGGIIAVLGVIILPITSGDTALRSLRLIIADTFHIKQKKIISRILLSLPLFGLVFFVLVWAKMDPNGFNMIWRYFGLTNQSMAVFALLTIMIWLMTHDRKKYLWVPLIPLVFYAFITSSYLLSASIGFRLPLTVAYPLGAVVTVVVAGLSIYRGNKKTVAVRE